MGKAVTKYLLYDFVILYILGAKILANFWLNCKKITIYANRKKLIHWILINLLQKFWTKYLLYDFDILYPGITIGCHDFSWFWPGTSGYLRAFPPRISYRPFLQIFPPGISSGHFLRAFPSGISSGHFLRAPQGISFGHFLRAFPPGIFYLSQFLPKSVFYLSHYLPESFFLQAFPPGISSGHFLPESVFAWVSFLPESFFAWVVFPRGISIFLNILISCASDLREDLNLG